VKPLILIALLLAAGCSKEPAPAAPKKATDEATKSDANDAVKETKKSIEEAADAAVKLVEEEAREEIGALEGAPAQ
jgi:cellobiose-specific phosphotransferase system component IIA